MPPMARKRIAPSSVCPGRGRRRPREDAEDDSDQHGREDQLEGGRQPGGQLIEHGALRGERVAPVAGDEPARGSRGTVR